MAAMAVAPTTPMPGWSNGAAVKSLPATGAPCPLSATWRGKSPVIITTHQQQGQDRVPGHDQADDEEEHRSIHRAIEADAEAHQSR
jgi:hypothetical protein